MLGSLSESPIPQSTKLRPLNSGDYMAVFCAKSASSGISKLPAVSLAESIFGVFRMLQK
jgi:hypothetical protein